jgi:hypothetical protein
MDQLEVDGVSLPQNQRIFSSLKYRSPSLVLRNGPSYNNAFNERARQGFKYWYHDKTNPENNKSKGKPKSIFLLVI